MTERNGSAEWRGDVQNGSGTLTVGPGVFEGAYSFASRFGEGAGTNPEQLIAASHAACYSMALSNLLSQAGHVPDSVRTRARVDLRNIDGAPTLSAIHLVTEGQVPGISQDEFSAFAEQAKVGCPISRALAGVPEITLEAKLV
jgi:osmotically inducible protein OsmC